MPPPLKDSDFQQAPPPLSDSDFQTQQPQQPQQKAMSFSDSIWNGLVGGATKVTDALGLHGAVDTTATNLAGMGNSVNGLATGDIQGANERNKFIGQPSLEQNVGTGLQLGAMTAGASAAPTSLLGSVGAGALLGGAQAGGGSMAQNESVGTVAKKTATGAAIGGAVSGAITGIGQLGGKLGDKIQMSVIKPSKADIADGFSMDTIKNHDLGGSLNQTLEKSQSALKDLSEQLNEKLQGSDATINLQDVYQKTAKQLTSNKGSLGNFGMNTKLGSALEGLQNEIGSLNASDGLSIPDAQIVKQAAGGYGAWTYGRPDPESKAGEAVYNAFYSNLKKAIEDNSPDGVKAINKQMSDIIPVMNAVIRRIPVAERNNAISLTDMIGLVGSTFHPAALGPTVLNLLSKSGVVGNQLSKLAPTLSGAAPALGGQAGGLVSGQLGQPTPDQGQ